MPQCKLCNEYKSDFCLRETDRKLTEAIRSTLKKTSFHYNDKVCTGCIDRSIRPSLERSGKLLSISKDFVALDDKTAAKISDAVKPNSTRSSANLTELELHLHYMKQATDGRFSSHTTVENIMMYLIETFTLDISKDNLILTMITPDDKNDRPVKVLASPQMLSDLNIGNDAHLYFEDFQVRPGNGSKTTDHSSSPNSSYKVTVNYSKTESVVEYQIYPQDTVGGFLTFITQKFRLKDIDKHCLQLSSNCESIDITNSNKTLISAGFGTKYLVIDLKTVSNGERQLINNEKMNGPNDFVVECRFPPQTIVIDPSAVSTFADLKLKIIDKLKLQTLSCFIADDVCMEMNGTPITSTDDQRQLPILDNRKRLELAAVINIFSDGNRRRARKNEGNIGTSGSQSAKEKREALLPRSIMVAKRIDPIGLRNIGNTCFMNSTLQCLSHVVPLTTFFLNTIMKEHDNNRDNKVDTFETYGEVTCAYARFIWHMWKSKEPSFSPDEMRGAIGKIDPRFSTYQQQDAHEFMNILITALHSEMEKKKNNIIKRLFYGTINSITTCLQCKKRKITQNIISFLPIPLIQSKRSFIVHYISYENKNEEEIAIEVIASGRIEHLLYEFLTRKCLRKHRLHVFSRENTSRRFEKEDKLSKILEHTVTICDEGYDRSMFDVQLSHFNDKLTLIDCIHEFLAVESIGNTRFCNDLCKSSTNAVRQIQLSTLPPVLIIQLKRFTKENGCRQKIQSFVDYPVNGLDLNDMLYNNPVKTVYDLIAVSNHRGFLDSGHYTAYARQDIDGPWYEFNDTCVRKLENDRAVVTHDAYLLVYLQRYQDIHELIF